MRRDNRRGSRNDDRAAINDQIRATEVRLIGADGNQVGVVSIQEALQIAEESELDLVQISDGDPIVCKVMDFGKKLYEEKKQKAEAKKKQHQVQIKEMKFRPGTEEGDYQIKLRNLTRFLEGGDKAKVSLRFRGREMAHQNIGMELMRRIEADLAEMGVVEQHPKMEGRQMVMVIAPGKKK
ncbi:MULTISPECIES: translation initiation factor IF-3 [unclassified Oceanobacter]|uniref:translation initiation factor IF-3 n=1 Tax=unclassified Oceanobacter TaxID=2620260 RepID=UPI0026E35BFC|nr:MULTISPECIES: translation initiation factor IF-3 [unclassified Oceanobacter]MDO6682756.1 translation initiation factor IF-3 [Oceanobacter sp. 5_MG-2023]MDP2504828.1 translation initiation factor IF-3 [Oceanobacter sp. 3_MG-2023]MDP2546272.1 translation initiation factor IF-3 [Oceanobacter sp. 4_MG-2023]MDP2607573.1 translation initiation factor IF-3 [Oceanobacter sp. 1_MG-2023]MDP2610841.1 translation initiation factor IF-3 [Oceanobacter sp. 2_MG-2023]